MNHVRNGEWRSRLQKTPRQCAQVHVDTADLAGVLGVVRRYLHNAAVWRESKMVRGSCIAETHSSMRLASLHDYSVMVVVLRDHDQ